MILFEKHVNKVFKGSMRMQFYCIPHEYVLLKNDFEKFSVDTPYRYVSLTIDF